MAERSKEHAKKKSSSDTIFWLFLTYLAFLVGGFIVYGANQGYAFGSLDDATLRAAGIAIGAVALAAHIVLRYILKLSAIRAFREFVATRETGGIAVDGFAVLRYEYHWIGIEAAIGVLLRLTGSDPTSAAQLVGGAMIAIPLVAVWFPHPSIDKDIEKLGLPALFGPWGVVMALLGLAVFGFLLIFKVYDLGGWLVMYGGLIVSVAILQAILRRHLWWTRI